MKKIFLVLIFINVCFGVTFDTILKHKINDCGQNDAVGCYEAGHILYDPFRSREYKEAMPFFEKACKLKNADGCFGVAEIYYDIYRDYKKAVTYYEKACEMNNKRACNTIGIIHSYDLFGIKDLKKTIKYYKKACDDLKHGASCSNLAQIYKKDKKIDLTILYYQKACNLNFGKGCFYLSEFYEKGKGGVSKNKKKEEEYLKKACNLEELKACEKMGITYRNTNYYELAKNTCKLNIGWGCRNLGEAYKLKYKGPAIDIKKSFKYYKKACKLGIKEACSTTAYLYSIGKGVLKNHQKAKDYYEKACYMKDKRGCQSMGDIFYTGEGVRQDYYQSNEYYKKACELKDDGGCFRIGRSFLLGEGVRQDYKTAKKYLKKSCQMNNLYGCFGLAFLYEIGKGVKQNKSFAKEYYGRSCDLGYQEACEKYKELNN